MWLMRLSIEKIKQGILHPDRDVRDAAVMHFSGPLAATRQFCRSPSKQLKSTDGRGLFSF